MLGQPGELRVRTGAGQDRGIARRDHATALAFERACDDCGSAVCSASTDDLVDEVDQLIWETNGDLLAHPNMVADWYHGGGRPLLSSKRSRREFTAARRSKS